MACLLLLRGLGLLGLRFLLLLSKYPGHPGTWLFKMFQSAPGIQVLGFSKYPGHSANRTGPTGRHISKHRGNHEWRAFFFFAAVSWVRASDVFEIVFFTSSLNPHVFFSKYSLRFALQSAPDSNFISRQTMR